MALMSPVRGRAREVSFTVIGCPKTQGSMKGYTPKGWKRPVITHDNKALKPWRQEISAMAQVQMHNDGVRMADRAAVGLMVTFYFTRPKSANKGVTDKVTKPDIDKLVRGVMDALTGIVFRDDAQVIWMEVGKLFGSPERAEIYVTW